MIYSVKRFLIVREACVYCFVDLEGSFGYSLELKNCIPVSFTFSESHIEVLHVLLFSVKG